MERPGLTFIVRVTPADADQLTGTVERVRTGEKQRFIGLEGLGALIAGMVGEATKQPEASTAPQSPDESPSTP